MSLELVEQLEGKVNLLKRELTQKRAAWENLRIETELAERLLRAYQLILDAERHQPMMSDEAPGLPIAVDLAPHGTVGDEVTRVLLEKGHPMHADELVIALQSRGVPLSAKDPKASVVTAIVRGIKKGVFQRTAPNTYRLVQIGGIDVKMEEAMT